MNEICGVYYIRNITNDKVYVGSSVDIKKRWRKHIKGLKDNKYHSPHLQNAWNKYGEENFAFYIKEIVIFDDILRKREGYWQNYYRSYDDEYGYNLMWVNENGIVHHSEETRKKMSIASKGREFSKETRQKLSEDRMGEKNPFYGKHHSEETKQKISGASKGEKNGMFEKHHSEETRQEMSIIYQKRIQDPNYMNPNKGRKLSEESKRNMSIAQQKLVQDPNYIAPMSSKEHSKETKQKISIARQKIIQDSSYVHPMQGKHHSEETKQKISIGNKGKKRTEESKQNISKARKGIKFTEKAKQNMSKAQSGEKNPMYGKKISKEHRENLRIAYQKRAQDPDYIHPLKGRKVSEETKAKISESLKKRNGLKREGVIA